LAGVTDEGARHRRLECEAVEMMRVADFAALRSLGLRRSRLLPRAVLLRGPGDLRPPGDEAHR